jgi:hypothetical protein
MKASPFRITLATSAIWPLRIPPLSSIPIRFRIARRVSGIAGVPHFRELLPAMSPTVALSRACGAEICGNVRQSARLKSDWLGGRESAKSFFVRLPIFATSGQLFPILPVSHDRDFRPLSSACYLLPISPARCHSKWHSTSDAPGGLLGESLRRGKTHTSTLRNLLTMLPPSESVGVCRFCRRTHLTPRPFGASIQTYILLLDY